MTHKDHYRNGIRLVSATELQSSLAKPFLDKWKESLCGQNDLCGFINAKCVAEEAAELGNRVHELVAMHLKGEFIPPEKGPAAEWAAKIIERYRKHEIKPYLIEPEETLIDAESGLAGSPDHVVMWDGEPFIGDLKVKNQLDAYTGMQGMAYRYLIRRLHGVDIRWMRITHAKKKTVSKVVDIVDIDLDLWKKPWGGLVEIWNIGNPRRRVTIHD